MPEIPEIETVKRHLVQKVQGKVISEVVVNRAKSLNVPAAEFIDTLTGQKITSVRRRAKQIVISLEGGSSIVVHFMLEGYMRLFFEHEEVDKTPSVLLSLHTQEHLGLFKLNLGYAHLAHTTDLAQIEELSDLGPEPLADDFTVERFIELLGERKGMVKPLLMDQQFIAGIGNVYSNETLFCAGILPERKVAKLTRDERVKLYHCIRDILHRSIDMGGVYEEKFSSADTLTGGFEPHLQVAYRTGQPCYACGHTIETKRVGGRNAFFCPVCQK